MKSPYRLVALVTMAFLVLECSALAAEAPEKTAVAADAHKLPTTAPTPAGPPSPGEAEKPAAPKEIKVGLYVLNLGKLDVSTGAFTADFYLSLYCDDGVPDLTFEFQNGRAATVDKLVDKPNEKTYRISANLSTKIDLRRFPFDAQKMQIMIEDKRETIDRLKYVPYLKETGIDPAIVFPGWNITGWEAEVREHEYSVYGETYSQYIFTVDIERIKFNSFLKTFLPPIFMMLIVMTTFILNPEQVNTRLATISSSLVASVMFHVSISNQIPPVGYLTFADKFMLLTYLILLSTFFLTLRVFVLQGRQEAERAKKLNRLAERLVFIGLPSLYVLLFLFVR